GVDLLGVGPGDVDAAGALFVDGVSGVGGGADECGFELFGVPVRMGLLEDRGGAGHVRGGHRGAAGGDVVVVDRDGAAAHVGAGGAGGGDGDSRGGDVGLHRAV